MSGKSVPVPTRRKPARQKLEELLGDGQWHAWQEIYPYVTLLIDPRVAVRTEVSAEDGARRCGGGAHLGSFWERATNGELEVWVARGRRRTFNVMLNKLGIERRVIDASKQDAVELRLLPFSERPRR